RTLAKQQAEELHDAAVDLVGAESSTLEALKREHDAANARARAAEDRKNEAEYLAAARKYARDAQNDEAQARQALEHVEEETARQLAGEIELLSANIADLRQKLPALQEGIKTASANLEHFRNDASDRHRAKQSQRALFSILKKIGSLVSIYFTGVDLVTIAETAVQAVRSASSGDWAGAIMHARDAADMATGGKFSQALSRGIETAERYIGSVMTDSLQGAADKIGNALGVPPSDALKGAIDAVGRQAFRIGVSFLARETGTT